MGPDLGGRPRGRYPVKRPRASPVANNVGRPICESLNYRDPNDGRFTMVGDMTRKSKPARSCRLCKPHKYEGNAKRRDRPSTRRRKQRTASDGW